MTQWLVEEAMFEAVELVDRFKSVGGGNGGAPEGPVLTPHQENLARHEQTMAELKRSAGA